jgi:hypothetical protein
MQKLSKEQSEWLIESIDKSEWRDCEDPIDWAKQIIYECTEKEFPACSFETQNHRIISLHHCADVAVLNKEFQLDIDELKHLVLMLEEAVKWMEENED